MVTLVFKIQFSPEDQTAITALQRDYSQSFRKLYNNLELLEDPKCIKSLRVTSTKQREYLKKEVLTFHERDVANRKNIAARIAELEKEPKLELKKFRQLQRLRRSLTKAVCFGDKAELRRLSKGNGDKTKWQASRLLPLVFYGEVSRQGNRFFDLTKIASGQLTFKMEGTKFKATGTFNPRKHQAILTQLESLVRQKELPLTVKLTADTLYFTYDEAKVAKTNLDIKAFNKTIQHVKGEARKPLIAAQHRAHEARLKKGKLDRYLAVDLNPDGIGYCIVNKDLTVVTKGYLDVSKPLDANKRKYETSNVIKELFKLMTHHRCHTIITEELTLKPTDLGNKVSNRKVNNLWNRGLIAQIIQRKCNQLGLLRVEVNPAYSSFIGNLQHNEYDPIAASLELARRGIKKYSKGGFYPEFWVTTRFTDQMDEAGKALSTWKDLHSHFVTTKRSYRRGLKEFNFVGYALGSVKSGVQHLHFPRFAIA